MKIAMFSDSYTPYVSGVVRSLQRFSDGLGRLGHEVHLFAPAYSKFRQRQATESGAIVYRFYSIPAPTYPKFSLPIPVSMRMQRLARNINFDVIHTHTPFLMGRLGALLARKLRIPLVFTHHTLYHEYSHYVPAPRFLTRQAIIALVQHYCRGCNQIVAPTPQIRDLMQSLYRLDTPITPIPTGVDLDAYAQTNPIWLRQRLHIPPEDRIVLTVGRLGKEKNSRQILEAFCKLPHQLANTHLVFVGDGPEKHFLQATAASAGVRSRVHFTGLLGPQEVINCYAGSELFLFASTTETQGMVLVEAMAAGLPVVAVKATGAIDTIVDGKNGFLTERTATALAKATTAILADSTLYQSMAECALNCAASYSLEKTASKLVRVYKQALQG